MKSRLLYQIIYILLTIIFNDLIGQETHTHEHSQSHISLYEKWDVQDQVRMYWQMPNRVIDEIGVDSGQTVADIGCGTGYFSLRLAGKVGQTGTVYASDIDRVALAYLTEKARHQNIQNLKIIQGREDDPLLPISAIDMVLMVNTIHLIDRPSAYLSQLKSCLRQGGRLVIVQWDAEKMDPEAPDWSAEDREKYTQQTTLRIIYDAGYEVERIQDFLPMQRIYICLPRQSKSDRSGYKLQREKHHE